MSSKWVVKQPRKLTTSTMHLAQELLTNVQFRKFCKGDESFEDKEHAVAGYQKLTTPTERIIKADPLTTI